MIRFWRNHDPYGCRSAPKINEEIQVKVRVGIIAIMNGEPLGTTMKEWSGANPGRQRRRTKNLFTMVRIKPR
jgi:hypothetical protein